MDISAGVVVREGQLIRKGPDLVSIMKADWGSFRFPLATTLKQ